MYLYFFDRTLGAWGSIRAFTVFMALIDIGRSSIAVLFRFIDMIVFSGDFESVRAALPTSRRGRCKCAVKYSGVKICYFKEKINVLKKISSR